MSVGNEDGGTLPAGWTPTTLGQIVRDIQPGFASGKHTSDGEGLPHLRPMNVTRDGSIDRSDLRSVDPALAGKASRRLRRGDVLFNNTNSPELVGKTALFDDDDEPGFSNHMTRLRVLDEVAEPAFIAHLLHGRWRCGEFQRLANNHVSQASISRGVLENLSILLPPRAEQTRIVARLHEIGTRREALIGRLEAARATIDRVRPAVLSAACSGQLTADWRQDNPSDAASTDLARHLDTVRKDRAAVGDGGSDGVRWPAEWHSSSLGELLSFVTSGSRGWAKYYAEEGPLFIRAQNISGDRLSLTDVAHVRPPTGAEGARTRARRGDVLVTITGANVTKTALIESDIPEAYVNQHVALARPLLEDTAAFIHLWLVSPAHGRKTLLSDAYGAGKPGLNLSNVRAVPIALPSLAEQRMIVDRARSVLDRADHLAARIDHALTLVDRVAASCTTRAFRGELVPTEATRAGEDLDAEPANEALERDAAGQRVERHRRETVA